MLQGLAKALHEQWLRADEAKYAARLKLEQCSRALAQAWVEFDSARRLEKNLKERVRKKLQKADHRG